MSKPKRSMAEKKFALVNKKSKKALSEREVQELKTREKTANLRALRLQREEADRAAAEASTEKPAVKRKPPAKIKRINVAGY